MYSGSKRIVYCVDELGNPMKNDACIGIETKKQAATVAGIQAWAERNAAYMTDKAVCMDQATRNSLVPANLTGADKCITVT